MNIIKRLFSRHKLKDIFTPTTIAKLAYVNRNNIEKDLEKYLNIPGKQIIIYGHSGSGKTTLLRNKLKDIKQNSLKPIVSQIQHLMICYYKHLMI